MRSTSSSNLIKPASRPWRMRAASVVILFAALFASAPASAGIQYGRDDWSNVQDPTLPVCTPGCSASQTCTPLFSTDPNDNSEWDLCLNNKYPLNFMGTWQPQGRTHHVGDVVTDPVTGEAFIFVDVSVPIYNSNFFTIIPPLTDTTSWQPFSIRCTNPIYRGPREPRRLLA